MPAGQFNVPYLELSAEYGLMEGSDNKGGWAKKPYLVSWGQRLLFVRQVLGYSSVSGGVGGSWLRQYPMPYPESPDLYANSVEVKPHGTFYKTTPMSFDYAIVTVTFRAPDWSYDFSGDDPLFLNSFSQDPTENLGLVEATQQVDFGVDWLPITNAVAKFQIANTKVTTQLSKRVMVARMVITWHDLPYMPLDGILTYADVLNDDDFLGRPRGKVMMEGAKTSRRRKADGTIVQDVTVSLKTRSFDWNKGLNPSAQPDFIIFNNDVTQLMFPYVDFSGLLFIGN